MSACHILVVDDDPFFRDLVSTVLTGNGYEVLAVSDGSAALASLAETTPDLILIDVMLPDMDGFDLYRQCRRRPEFQEIPAVFVTALDDKASIDRIFDAGAADYVAKPIRENELLARVRLHLQLRRQAFELLEDQHEISSLRNRLLNRKLDRPDVFRGIITASPVMLSIFQYLEAIAVTSRPVLISGDTGVGKELVARAVHELSGRQGQFVAVNVAGLDDTLFSDHLFGHEKGAFTGALTARQGMIESASGGTLFLDEIGDLASASQVKLLRLLQEREYYPIGSDTRRLSDARVVVATHANLAAMIEQGSFREDLYYRLRTHHLELPPLRERRCDINLLVNYFIAAAARQLGKEPPALPAALGAQLRNYDWPGNVRELEAVVFDAVTRCRNRELTASLFDVALPSAAAAAAGAEDSGDFYGSEFPTLKAMTEMLIKQALERSRGNQALAASLLGITRQALNKRLNRRAE